ncbi:MAG TPA: hypothetical protein DCW68_00165 [Rhodospirillaceae bacterium]|nr:MAG: hypothetical protein A2018_01480 [Alphaproteobacteria bacterium GWF2_58_20]HAU28514.1 hypothetical protein [Rhodospirillaceae bacterium]
MFLEIGTPVTNFKGRRQIFLARGETCTQRMTAMPKKAFAFPHALYMMRETTFAREAPHAERPRPRKNRVLG